MEGISGIVNPHQTNAGKAMFDEGRQLYTEEINAAVRGAKAGGATEILVMDCHGAGEGYSWNSLIAEELDPDCEFVVQDQWTRYTAFLESGCDVALFVGMHAMAGTSDGVLNHTVSGVDWQNLWFNGTRVGETGINAALCGTWGCPVLLVTGDRAAGHEARALLGEGLTTVEVKEGLGAKTARLLPPRRYSSSRPARRSSNSGPRRRVPPPRRGGSASASSHLRARTRRPTRLRSPSSRSTTTTSRSARPSRAPPTFRSRSRITPRTSLRSLPRRPSTRMPICAPTRPLRPP